MAFQPVNLGRVSTLMRGHALSSALGRTQSKLNDVQTEINTGRRLNKVSDDVADGATAQSVRKLLEQRAAYADNLTAANDQLSEVDTNLGDVSDLLRQAQTLASANVGSDTTPDSRAAAAEQIDSIYNQVLALANTQSNGVYLYGGDRSNAAPFVEENGGVRWAGSSRVLGNQYDESSSLDFMVDGANVFGATSARMKGATDLAPTVSADTRLHDLGGATNAGVRRGVISVSNGAAAATIDLGDADTIQDVVDRINGAGVGGITASVNAAGTGIDLAAGAGDSLTVTDVGGGSTATDLGIARATPAGAGVGIAGGAVNARVTNLTPLSSLRNGAGLDLSGIRLTVNGAAKDISFAGATTVEDVLNRINDSGTGAVASINADGTGIDLVNAAQGSALSIAENGGATADELGLRSFTPATTLADLNGGRGITRSDGPEMHLVDSAGVGFDVDLDSASTMQDVIDAINSSATAAGASVTASFATATNGLVLTDGAGGAGTLAVQAAGSATIVKELGLDAPVSGNVLTGRDVAPVESTGVFASLDRLRDALRNDDQNEITRSAETLDGNLSNVVLVRGQVGARVQAFESRQSRLDDQNLASKALLSQLEDADFTDTIVRFQQLQTALQASMQAAGQTMNLSLLDFLH